MTITATRAKPGAPLTRVELLTAHATADQLREIDLGVHEAGHAVATVLYGGMIRSAVLTASGGVVGLRGLTTLAGAVPGGRTAEIAYAGPYAQAAWVAGRRPNGREMRVLLAGGSRCDDTKLRRELAVSATTGTTVVPLLERAWPSVVAVAAKLFKHGEVCNDDVLAALGITDGGGPGSFQLANVRAGMRRPVATAT
jgi:hypothetical protein